MCAGGGMVEGGPGCGEDGHLWQHCPTSGSREGAPQGASYLPPFDGYQKGTDFIKRPWIFLWYQTSFQKVFDIFL